MLAILHIGPLDLLGGLVTLGDLNAVAEAAHVDLGRRGSLAGMEALGVQNDVELAVDLDDIALTERAGDDSHNAFPRYWGSTAPGRVARDALVGRRCRGATY